MKKRAYKPIGLLFLLLASATCMSLIAQDAMKQYTESFEVSRGVTLVSDTKYSDIELLTWEKNTVDILVDIKVEASSKGAAENKLEKIQVTINQEGTTINLLTDFDEGWSMNAKVEIQITIKAPNYLNINLESAYGDVFIQELTGLVLGNIRYGNLKAGSLTRGNEKPFSRLDLAYSNGTVEKAGWMEVELAYSDLEIGESRMLFAESKYSKLTGEKTGGIVTEGAYDKYIFDEVDNFVAELRYSGVQFGTLQKKLSVESKYTNVKVEHVSKDFKEITASLSYGNIYLDVEQGTSFKFDGMASYGKINLEMEGKLSRMKENNEMKIWGTVGSDPGGEMRIETRYGNIDIL
jgi:hypothetical protein